MSAGLQFTVEHSGESNGFYDCCGNQSRTVWGLVHQNGPTVAAYWMHWTAGHLSDPGANLDMILGKWGDGTTASDRVAISLVHREMPDGSCAVMVIDACDRPFAQSELVGDALDRDEVIGTPLAANVFALVDAIYENDDRFF